MCRSSNLTSKEENEFVSSVEKYAYIVKNKKTNAIAWQETKKEKNQNCSSHKLKLIIQNWECFQQQD